MLNGVLTINTNDQELIKEIESWEYDNSPFKFLEKYKDAYVGSGKWYENTEDMLALSKRFPGVIFTLTGNGENEGDL